MKKRLNVTVAGIAVSITLDDEGRPLAANAGIARPKDLDSERLTALAVANVWDAASAAAQRMKLKRKAY